jgi:chromate transport protein ChrA
MLSRLVRAIIYGLVAALIALVLIAILSALIPAVSIDASWWAGVIGLLVGLYVFFTGTEPA